MMLIKNKTGSQDEKFYLNHPSYSGEHYKLYLWIIMKFLLAHACFIVLFVRISVGQTTKQPETRSISTYFKAESKYLVLPVKNGSAKRNLELWVDGVNTRFLDIELAEAEPDWYAYLNIEQWKDKKIELRVNKVAVDSKVFSPVRQSDKDSNAGLTYHEKYRGQFHFSPKRGWTNDPNGMVYFNGEYHLFFQHNPYGTGWGNMTWGHAVSKDLVHWTELDDAIHPDQYGPVFSGSAVVDEKNTSGLGKDGKAPLILFHTGARAWAQCLSWSQDARNFHTLPEAPLPRINKDNRDPKVIWHEPTKKWVMVVWVERENRLNTMQFLTSPNLLDWTETAYVKGGAGDDRYLFECPEFYELPVDGTNQKKWILTGANTEYAIGSFDGKTFVPEAERLQGQYGRDFYAPQTFNNEPNGRRIEIGWWRTNTAKEGMIFNQSQSIPLEHTLIATKDGPRLSRLPVKELEMLRTKTYDLGKFTLNDKSANPLKDINAGLVEIRMQIEPLQAKKVAITVRGVPIVYDAATQQLKVDGVTAPAPLQNGKLDLIVFADRIGLEIFANRGLLFMPINITIPPDNKQLSLSAVEGTSVVSGLTVYELKSIW